MKTKQLFISLLSLVAVLSIVSLANAAGTWSNPTGTPPANNVEAPINVGASAQDKSGVLRVTGFRSFFDAIFDTKVQIGTTGAMPSNLKLLTDGKVGAEAYCDRQGNNCITSSGIPVSSNSSASSTSSSGGGFTLTTPTTLALIGTGPYYPNNGKATFTSNWQSISLAGKVPSGTTGVLLGLNGNCGEGFIRSNLDPVLPAITRNNSYVEPNVNFRAFSSGGGDTSQRWIALDSSQVIYFAAIGNGCDGGSAVNISVQGWKQ